MVKLGFFYEKGRGKRSQCDTNLMKYKSADSKTNFPYAYTTNIAYCKL